MPNGKKQAEDHLENSGEESLPEDREEWTEELVRHYRQIYDDLVKTNEVQTGLCADFLFSDGRNCVRTARVCLHARIRSCSVVMHHLDVCAVTATTNEPRAPVSGPSCHGSLPWRPRR